jgi:hypothetical protein
MPTRANLSSGVTHTPAGIKPTGIVHFTVWVARSIAANSFESCSVMKASLLSDVKATCEGAFGVARRLTNLKSPS